LERFRWWVGYFYEFSVFGGEVEEEECVEEAGVADVFLDEGN
jgi:hypothetical protein